MPGYKNPVIVLKFPELAEEGDSCHVVIRNPRLMSAAELQSFAAAGKSKADLERMAELATAADDEAADGAEVADGMSRMFNIVSSLIVGWRVWDPRVPIKVDDSGELIENDETRPQLLPLPATPELTGLLPNVILMKVMEEVGSAINPQQTPAEPTSSTS